MLLFTYFLGRWGCADIRGACPPNPIFPTPCLLVLLSFSILSASVRYGFIDPVLGLWCVDGCGQLPSYRTMPVGPLQPRWPSRSRPASQLLPWTLMPAEGFQAAHNNRLAVRQHRRSIPEFPSKRWLKQFWATAKQYFDALNCAPVASENLILNCHNLSSMFWYRILGSDGLWEMAKSPQQDCSASDSCDQLPSSSCPGCSVQASENSVIVGIKWAWHNGYSWDCGHFGAHWAAAQHKTKCC